MGVRGWIFHLCVSHLLNFEVCTWERGETQTLEQVWSTHVLVAQALGEDGAERCGLGQCREIRAVGEGDGRNAIQREQNLEEKGKMRRQALRPYRREKEQMPEKQRFDFLERKYEMEYVNSSWRRRALQAEGYLPPAVTSRSTSVSIFFSWTNSLFGYFSSCFASLWLPL